MSLALSGCTSAEALQWPTAPVGARSYLMVVLGEDTSAVVARDGVDPAPFSTPPGPLFLRYSNASLTELALEQGPVPLGNDRPLPASVAAFERAGDRWQALEDAEVERRLANVKLAAPEHGACLGAGGCYGLSPDKEQCNLPCPCPQTPLATEPYPNTACQLPDSRDAPCYQSRGLLPGLGVAGVLDTMGSVVADRGGWALYFATDRFGPRGLPRLARAVLEPSISIRPGSIEPIELGLDPKATADRPYVRADNLELWFQSRTTTSADTFDAIWVASRRRLDAPFAQPKIAQADAKDHYRYPMLLGDYRTLLYRSEMHATVAVVRSSTIAGDARSLDGQGLPFALAAGQGAISLNLGCDRQSILYLRTMPSPYRLMIANVATINPLELHSVRQTLNPDRSPLEPGTFDELSFVETPDCRHLLVSGPEGTQVYEAVACPE